MSTIQPTDVLLVNRAGVDYRVAKSAVMSTVQDSDLLLINRAGVDYKATFADVKKGFGPQLANPKPGDVAATPAFAGGTGTQADPFIITPSTVGTAGGTAQSAQQLIIFHLTKDDIIEFLDKSTGAGTRFKQPIGLAAGATWTGHLVYEDKPLSTGSTTYTGNLQIGTTYFRWVVTQKTGVPLVVDTTTHVAGDAEPGSTLTATPGIATGGKPPLSYAVRWQRTADATGLTGWADIAGATGNTYKLTASDLNFYVRAVTTASDSGTPPQTLELPSVSTPKVAIPAPVVTFGWNASTDNYTRDPVADRIIDVHARIRRCLLTDSGVATYLDADNSTKLAGDWLRLIETTELNTAYTGTHGAEVANTALRASAPAWVAGTYTKGQRVTHSSRVWECIVASTTATPAAGTAAATLNGTAGQVMVEIPRFSVWHETAPAGSHQRHTFHLARGTKVAGGYAVHPAFVKPDGSYRDFIYIGAYLGTGTNGNGSASGVNNPVNFRRAQSRAECSGRGAGWHQLGYWEYNALQWLLITEYQDVNSQKVLGEGASTGSKYSVLTGLSDARGNRSGNHHTSSGATNDYVSYRGVENFFGRAHQYIDGININNLDVYLCNNPAQWADDTETNYTASGSVPSANSDFQRDLMNGIALLPSSVTGGSETTYIGDSVRTSVTWRVAGAGGAAIYLGTAGAFCLALNNDSSFANSNTSGRLSYAA
jgi:hypothetical protein